MSTNAAPGSVGSLDEMRGIDERGIPLYYAGTRKDEIQFSGIIYTFHPGQITEIHDRREYPIKRDGSRDFRLPTKVPDGGNARAIVDFILEHMAERGVCRLFGDGRDDERKEAAAERHIGYRVLRARDVQANWLSTVKRSTSDGGLPPKMPKRVSEEISFLHDHADGALDRKPFICKIDGFDAATREEMVSYIMKTYPDQARGAENLDHMIIERDHGVRSQPATPRPVRTSERLDPAALAAEGPAPGQVSPSDAGYLLAKSRELEIKLTPDELEGLISGDEMTVENVTQKLATATADRRRAERASRA